MFKIGLLIGAMGLVGLMLGAGLIAYSQTRGKGSEILTRAYEAVKTPVYAPIVVRVNGVGIPGERVQIISAMYEEGKRVAPEEYRDVEAPDPRQVLDTLIRGELIYQEAERRGVLCSEIEVRELAEGQLQARELAEAWAAHFGVPVEELIAVPEVFKNYSVLCAAASLTEAVVPAGVTNRELLRLWDEFVGSLVARADIEILDPQLQ